MNLVLRGRSVLVVGGGPVATSKVEGLLDGGADQLLVVAPDVTDDLQACADDGIVAIERRPYASPEAAEHRLVVTATSDPGVNHQVFLDADAAGVWVNSADDPANCTFTLPARVRRGTLLVTVATGGHSPALSTWLRRRFEDEFGPEYDALVELLSAERESIKAQGRSTEGLKWQEALDAGLLDLLRADRRTEALELLRSCLSSSSG
ncbi:bifunctional precorrin-2 dehydrogenase/sirohydrochlorin ferrochelatase [Acidimicrobiia bacterium EGI L10123]|nr:bifunctional precorrin-2 dehydrogenase/sirohydrochlorin ferrochelatase [Acidimicrobiia bacterium EGI L10123]